MSPYGLKNRVASSNSNGSIYMTFLIVLILALFVPLMAVTEVASWYRASAVGDHTHHDHAVAGAHRRRHGSNRCTVQDYQRTRSFRWVSWGSMVATGLWVAVTALFSMCGILRILAIVIVCLRASSYS